MDELEQNLENLDELRIEAKNYANTLVLSNDERLNLEDREIDADRQAELLQKRDEQEAKLNEEMKLAEEAKDKPLFVPTSERYHKTESQKLGETLIEEEEQERKAELARIKEEQEARWKMQSENSFVGKITERIKAKITGNLERRQELLKQDYLEQVAQAAEIADLSLSQFEYLQETSKIEDTETITESQELNLEQDSLIDNIPNSTLEQIKDEELLFSMEKENEVTRTLKRNDGNVFTSILIIMTTLTIGIIAAVMFMK